MSESLTTDRLAELVRLKHDILGQLRDLARRQVDYIDKGEINKLLGLLATKQKLIVQIQHVESELNPFRDQDPEVRHWRSPDDRRNAADLVSRCETLLSEIMLLEKQSESDLSSQQDLSAQRLRLATDAVPARQAYSRNLALKENRFDIAR